MKSIQRYKMMLTIEEAKLRKRKGDLSLAADVMGISLGNASQVLERPLVRKHKELLGILNKVISMREMLKTTDEKNLITK